MEVFKKCRKKYDSGDSKRRLLKAALDIFAKDGYDGATTRAIAKKAGVNEALIQRYFDGKLGLLLALSQEFRNSLVDSVSLESRETLEEELTGFFRGRVEFARENKKIIKILITQAILNPAFRAQMERISSEAAPDLRHKLQVLKERDRIQPNLDLAKFVEMINSIAVGLNLITQVIDIREADYVDEFIPLIVKILCASMKREALAVKAA